MKAFPPAEAIASDAAADAAPGAVLSADFGGIRVAANPGVVRIAELQAEGKRRMSAADYLKGNPVPPGWRFV